MYLTVGWEKFEKCDKYQNSSTAACQASNLRTFPELLVLVRVIKKSETWRARLPHCARAAWLPNWKLSQLAGGWMLDDGGLARKN